jgi:hypothetical protein
MADAMNGAGLDASHTAVVGRMKVIDRRPTIPPRGSARLSALSGQRDGSGEPLQIRSALSRLRMRFCPPTSTTYRTSDVQYALRWGTI